METAREIVSRYVRERAAWFDKERHAGGDWNYLTQKMEECQYVGRELLARLEHKPHIACEQCGGSGEQPETPN